MCLGELASWGTSDELLRSTGLGSPNRSARMGASVCMRLALQLEYQYCTYAVSITHPRAHMQWRLPLHS